ncbi:MAG: nitronate monooxygenase family protein, partial [Candidatus Omnitrophota bacterium]
DRIKEAGLKVLHKVSTVNMALKAQEAGVDAVIATGYEAGGHIGRDEMTTFCLVPQLVDVLDIPVVAAGGIGDARGLVAAFALGAEGVEMGTRFVATRECPAPDYFKQSIVDAGDGATVTLGKKMPMRVLRNKKTESIGNPEKGEDAKGGEGEDGSYVQGDADTAIMPSGQVVGQIRDIKAIAEVFPEMIREAEALSTRLQAFFKG